MAEKFMQKSGEPALFFFVVLFFQFQPAQHTMAPALVIQPWDEFTDVSKYGLPTDVQSILDRLQQNVQRYLGNYAIFAGKYT
jgi:hypothetical protein